MRCGACPKSAAVPATVSDEPRADCHWALPAREGGTRRRPASQETCRRKLFLEAWRVSRAWSLVLEFERVPLELNAASEAVGPAAVDSRQRHDCGVPHLPRFVRLGCRAASRQAACCRHPRRCSAPRHPGRRGRMPRQLQAPAVGRAAQSRRLELRVRRPGRPTAAPTSSQAPACSPRPSTASCPGAAVPTR